MTAVKGKGRSEHGRIERQRILDYLHEHGPAHVQQLSDALGSTYKTTIDRLLRMRKQGEVVAEGRTTGSHRFVFYTPTVRTTLEQYPRSEQYKAMLERKLNGETKPRAVRPTVQGRWHYVHVPGSSLNLSTPYGTPVMPGDDHPLPHQGGQGNIPVGPQSSTLLEGGSY